MENAQLITLSRQMSLRNQMDMVANNMANLNTTGYKTQRMVFEEVLMPLAKASEFMQGDQKLSYVQDYGAGLNLLPGSIKLTGNDFDVAIDGEGWFAVQLEEGEAFTRSGAFHLDNTGTLVTAEGQPVLTDGGPISFTTEDGKIDIADDGTIVSELGIRGKLRVVEFETPEDIKALGGNLYSHEEPIIAASPSVVQGGLEQSNVRGVVEIAHMVRVTRAYESVSKLMADTDELRKQAIQTLGRLQA
ncbi:flagellar basal-body rod protein FlgF [Roseibium algae]|uniref:Flagellar basal-body rod protein FlgF n=1 Tax=Roseibium algae TaxID=3123038 RepID=A0ABU8TML2_9HYPH